MRALTGRLAALLILAAVLPSHGAQSADAVRIGKAVSSSFIFAGLELGKEQGIWASEGIDIQISAFRGDGQLQQALSAGALDFGLGSGPGMGYVVKGVPARAVASIAEEPRNMSVVVTNNGRVKTVDDLRGKRIGVTTAGSLTDWLARRLAADKGWGRDGVDVVPLGEMRTRLAAMKSGELDASVTATEESLQLQEQGVGRMLMTFGDAVPDFHTHVIFAADAARQKNPGLVRRVLRAWFKTAAFMRDNRAATVKSVAKTMALSEKVVDRVYDEEIKMLSYDGAFSPKALDVIRLSLKELGILEQVPDAKNLYDGSFTPVKF
ncbi:MAG: ABC transporter substrate-binding protein [Xanthobacteraceae bacterium]|nr:ABC transporter substrate-binding protein [Xanthobacteraceae bacterium]